MSKTPNLPFSGRRDPFPAIPYSLTPSPLTTPSRSQNTPNVVVPNPGVDEQNREIWKSIETLVRAQTDILQAQTANLLKATNSISNKLDTINVAEKQLVSISKEESRSISQGIEDLKAMVRVKQEEGYRFPRYIDFERVMSMGWMNRDVYLPFNQVLATPEGSVPVRKVAIDETVGIDIDVKDGHGSAPPLRLDEIIDMNQFEDHHDGTVPEESSAPALRSPSHKHTEPTASDGAGSGKLSRDNLAKLDESNQQNTVVSTNLLPHTYVDQRQCQEATAALRPGDSSHPIGEASSSRMPIHASNPRDTDQEPLSSSVESLAQSLYPFRSRSQIDRPRAGSTLSDIFGGINDYLERPNRRRHIQDTQSPSPPPPPTQSEGRLRRRTKRPIYSTKWHPMDKPRKYLRLEEEREAAADAANEEIRSVRGLSTARVVILPKSDGVEKMGAREWWKWGENTLKGRMDEISCDLCRGRVHWACAGLSSDDDMNTEAWACPDCLYIINRNHKKTPQPVAHAQQDRCIRPNCIVRSRRPLTKKKGDDSRHFVERSIGRRVIARRANGSRIFEYLCKWENWEMYECTWQEPKSFDGCVNQLETIFLAQCAKEGVNAQGKVALLQECEGFWDENGDLKRDLLEELGIPEAEWWPDPKGKYKVRHA